MVESGRFTRKIFEARSPTHKLFLILFSGALSMPKAAPAQKLSGNSLNGDAFLAEIYNSRTLRK
jgi:hypothetical protein